MSGQDEQNHPDTHKGLRTPGHSALSIVERPSRSSLHRTVQLIALIVGIVMLVWVIRLATTDENREQLSRLLSEGWGTLAIVLALASITLFLNGAMFWAVIRPLHALPFWHIQRVNAAATMAAPLPYKISMAIRFAVHRKIDELPYTHLIAWFGSFGILMLSVALPLTLVSYVLDRIDALWWVASTLAVLASVTALLVVMRWSRTRPRLRALTLDAGAMLGDPTAIWQSTLLRLLDMLCFGLRFWLVSRAIGHPMGADEVVMATSVFLVAGTVAPAGTLGIREGAVASMGFLPGSLDPEVLASVTLVVSAAEIVSAAIFGSGALLWLKPWKLIARRPS
ncbi:MAG: lysylphosphatidylglycerol synthase domain-containing protein [Phycisphaerales bacterium JB043]